MRELNIRHLQHDYDTDVLSFLFEARGGSWTPADAEGLRGAGKRIEGEIIISADMACDMAQDFGWSPREELLLYLVHGLLHLAGYDDQTESEQALMRSRERTILSRWNLAPHYSDAETEAPDQLPGDTNSSPTHTEGRP
jgi:probable rRNA maturation factor